MSKNTILKIAGVVGTVVGAVCLFLSGTGEQAVTAVVGGVFALAAVIIAIFKK